VYLPSLVGQDELAGAIGKTGSSESAAQLAGRALGGVLAQWFGAVLSLLADPVTFLVSAVCLVSIRSKETPVPQRTPGHSLRRDIGEGLRWLRRDPYLRGLALFGGVGNLGLTGYAALQVVFLVRVIGVSASAVGALVAVTGAGGVVGALLAGALGAAIGVRPTAWVMMGILLCAGLIVLAGPIRHGRELPATPEPDWRDSGPVPDRTGG
jgi:predicted MFS family arabinose efflux permease